MLLKHSLNMAYRSLILCVYSRDARAILERNIKLNQEGTVDDKMYHGQAGYKNFIQKDPSQVGANKHTGYGMAVFHSYCIYMLLVVTIYLWFDVWSLLCCRTQGPIRAPSFVRSSARFDYQVHLCFPAIYVSIAFSHTHVFISIRAAGYL